jgi:RNA polymerase sigma-70 factor, ECF subfamily
LPLVCLSYMILILPGQPLTNSAIHHKQVYIPVENLYKQCFHAYFEKLFGYAFTIVKDNAEAKDIVQSAFVKLWEKRGEINFPAAARAYLYTTVYHLALNTVRDRKIRERHLPAMAPAAHVNSIDTAQEKEIKVRIQLAIDALPPRCREVFCKSRLEGKKYNTIALEMNISVKTVEVQMGKALKLLREQLADLASIWIIFLFL